MASDHANAATKLKAFVTKVANSRDAAEALAEFGLGVEVDVIIVSR
jgi:hypothetical protein